MTDGVLLRETLKDSDLEKYRYGKLEILCLSLHVAVHLQSEHDYLLSRLLLLQCRRDG